MTKEEYSWVTSAAWDLLARFVSETYDSRPDIEYNYDLDWFQRFLLWYRRGQHARNWCISACSLIPSAFLSFFRRCAPKVIYTPYTSFQAWLSGRSALYCLRNFLCLKILNKPLHDWPHKNLVLYPIPRLARLHSLINRSPVISKLILYTLLAGSAYLFFRTSRLHLRSLHDPNRVYRQYADYFHNGLYTLRISRRSTCCLLAKQPFGDLSSAIFVDVPEPIKPSFPPVTVEVIDTDNSPHQVDNCILPTIIESKLEDTPLINLDTLPSQPELKIESAPPSSRDSSPDSIQPNLTSEEASSTPELVDSQCARLLKPTALETTPCAKFPEPTPSEIKAAKPLANGGGLPELAPLLSDPSASGPVLPWHTINVFPPDPTTAFHCRKRSDPTLPSMPLLNCLMVAVSELTGESKESLWSTLARSMPNVLLRNSEVDAVGLSTDHLAALSYLLHVRFNVHSHEYPAFTLGPSDGANVYTIYHQPGHWQSRPTLTGANLIQRRFVDPDFEKALLGFTYQFNGQSCLLPFLRFHEHHTNQKRAKVLCSNLKNRFDGVLRDALQDPKLFANLDNVVDFAGSRTVKLCHLSGFAGCGKSRPIISFFRGSPLIRQMRVAVPNCDLRSYWKEQLRLPKSDNWRVSTWETSLLKNSRLLIIDEVYKMPPGYLDLICTLDPTIQYVVLLGDPIQGSYHSTSPDSSLKTLTPETTYLRKYIDIYCAWTFRSPQNIAHLFSIKCLSEQPGRLRYSRSFAHKLPMLTASESASKSLVSAGHSCQTIASSQGLSFDQIAIHIDSALFRVSTNLTLVALTRHKRDILLLGDIASTRKKYAFNAVLAALLDNAQIPLSYWPELNGVRIIHEPMTHRIPHLSGAGSISSTSRVTPDYDGDVIQPDFVLSLSGPDLIPNLPTTYLPE
nr:MAG: hypothetical protein [Picornaviridae sp.]